MNGGSNTYLCGRKTLILPCVFLEAVSFLLPGNLEGGILASFHGGWRSAPKENSLKNRYPLL
jgi:hypothetical protein